MLNARSISSQLNLREFNSVCAIVDAMVDQKVVAHAIAGSGWGGNLMFIAARTKEVKFDILNIDRQVGKAIVDVDFCGRIVKVEIPVKVTKMYEMPKQRLKAA